MRCTEVELLLLDYADGLADDRGRRIVERHIQVCRTCNDSVLTMRQLGQQLVRLPLLPQGVVERVPQFRRQLDQKLHRRPRFYPGPVFARTLFLTIIGLLCVLLWTLVTIL